MEIVWSFQHQLSLVGDNSLVHELRVMTAPQLTRNIPGILAECSLSVGIFVTSLEQLGSMVKEKTF